MAVLAPFKGLRFNPEKIRNLEEVVTPPYDVISEEDGAKFLEKNAYNMIQLDLRNVSHDVGGDSSRYTRARDLFESWQKEGVLIRDEQPAIYLYNIEYTHPSGGRKTRRGFIGLVGLAEFSEGIVKPHEKTFDTVIIDRLQLMDECRAQFSKVFSIYKDSEARVINTLESAREKDPVCTLRDHLGSVHTLWRVTDQEAVDTVITYFADKPVYIADGHHRYTTALGCMNNERAKDPDLPADSPYNFIMMYLCAAEDDGLSVLPTHRLLDCPGHLSADDCTKMLASHMKVKEIHGGSRELLVAELLSRMDEHRMGSADPIFGLYHAGEDRGFLLTLDRPLSSFPELSGKSAALQELDVVVLSELIIHSFLGLDQKRIVREKLMTYYSDADVAIDIAVKRAIDRDSSTPLVFLVNPTKVTQVTNVADLGEIMPHKSTYFYPKILTGLMLNKLVAGEHIYLPGKKR